MIRKFTPLLLRLKSISERKKSGYRVFVSEFEFVYVEAETAAIAIEKSSVKNPSKIEKSGIIRKSLFSEDDFNNNGGNLNPA